MSDRRAAKTSTSHKDEGTAEEEARNGTPDRKAQREAERKARMARLRSENEQEERKLDPLEGEDSDDDNDDGTGGRKKRKRNAASTKTTTKPQEEMVQVDEQELDGLDEEEQMRMLLGIEGFGSTKGQKVDSNHNSSAAGAAAKNKARKYRQYMNRKNGFNRPLDKMD